MFHSLPKTLSTGWWCNNHLEKYEFVNGVGMTSHIWNGNKTCLKPPTSISRGVFNMNGGRDETMPRPPWDVCDFVCCICSRVATITRQRVAEMKHTRPPKKLKLHTKYSNSWRKNARPNPTSPQGSAVDGTPPGPKCWLKSDLKFHSCRTA